MFESPFEKKQNSESKEKEIVLDLRLLETTQEWVDKYKDLMEDEFLKKKFNREKRLHDHVEYLESFASDVVHKKNKEGLYVVDIGPGPGELLEICRALGYKTKGYDAKIEDCEMGVPYIELSRHMAKRQKLDIEYCGFENILDDLPLEDNSVFMISSRGSIEQVFKKHLIGVPHREHHSARMLTWSLSKKMKEDFVSLFEQAKRVLVPGGIFLVYGNGATNISAYNDFILETISQVEGLTCDGTDNQTIHRIRKI